MSTQKKAPTKKTPPEKVAPEIPKIICPNGICSQDTIVNTASNIGRPIKILLSQMRNKNDIYHQNRLGQLYFDCFRCGNPIYLKVKGGFEVDTGE